MSYIRTGPELFLFKSRLKESTKRLKTHALNLKPNQDAAHQRQTKQQQQQQQKEQGLKTRLRKIKIQTMRQTIYT